MEFDLFIPIIPQPQRRARSARKQARPYKDAKTRAYELALATWVRRAIVGLDVPTYAPCKIGGVFCMPIAESWSKKKKANPPIHTAKPDFDNLLKGLKDGLQGVLWDNDSQVFGTMNMEKRYCTMPGIHLFCNYYVDGQPTSP